MNPIHGGTMIRLAKLVSITLLVSSAACGGSSDSTTGTNGSNNSGAAMSATIDGTAWSAPSPAASYQDTRVTIVGADVSLANSITMSFVAATTGTYSFALSSTSSAVAILTKNKGAQGFSTAAQAGGGSVTVTTLTAHHLVGTFAFDAVGTPASLGTAHVTNGKFDITF
jgi:hypothetical protein